MLNKLFAVGVGTVVSMSALALAQEPAQSRVVAVQIQPGQGGSISLVVPASVRETPYALTGSDHQPHYVLMRAGQGGLVSVQTAD